MSGSSWNLGGDLPGWRSDGNGLGDLLAVELVRGGDEGVTLDGDDELGEVAVADDPAELLLGDEHAGGGPALAHVAVVPVLYVALGVADDLDHALAGVRGAQRLREVAGDAEPHQRQRVGHALAERAGRVGPRAVEL